MCNNVMYILCKVQGIIKNYEICAECSQKILPLALAVDSDSIPSAGQLQSTLALEEATRVG